MSLLVGPYETPRTLLPKDYFYLLGLIWNTAVGFGRSALQRANSKFSAFILKEIVNCGIFITFPFDLYKISRGINHFEKSPIMLSWRPSWIFFRKWKQHKINRDISNFVKIRPFLTVRIMARNTFYVRDVIAAILKIVGLQI